MGGGELLSLLLTCTMYHVPCTMYHVPCTMYHFDYAEYIILAFWYLKSKI